MRSLRLLGALVWLLVATPTWAGNLETFVSQPDASYQYDSGQSWQEAGITFTEVHLTSQTFRGTPWKHVLTIAHPDDLAVPDHALLIIGGGRADQLPKKSPLLGGKDLARLKLLASQSKMTVAIVQEVPFQPIFDGKVEDDAIAFTLMQFFQTKDPTWPLLQPMVKSVVRAMDTVQAIANKTWHQEIKGFTITGESKRGWTTWLTAAVDPRVKAFAPMVFDIVNMRPQLQHQLESWGKYSEQIGDYSEQGLPKMLATPAGGELLKIMDPFSFRDKLGSPKVVVLATNDRYWPLDAASLYFDDLPGEKFLLYLPNEGHDLADRKLIEEDRVALALSVSGKLQLPKAHGNFIKAATYHGNLSWESDIVPKRVVVWQALAKTRDFRAAKWKPVEEPTPTSKIEVAVKTPKKGFVAEFVAASYDLAGHPFTATTPIGIVAAKSKD